MADLKIINPTTYPDWDNLILSSKDYSFFHTSSWAKVLAESYNYNPLYFTIIENNRLLCLIPLMEINSMLTGRRGVSLPFSDYCQSICDNKESFCEIIKNQICYGKESYWKYIEWRGDQTYFKESPPASFYSLHIIDLAKNENKILSSFRDSTKRNINKAYRKGINIRIGSSLGAIKAYYRLHCITRKYHGLPSQPWSFFIKIHEHVLIKKKGIVVLGFYKNKPVAGAVCFHFGTRAIFKYGACNRKYQKFRPNNLVMWKAIQWYKKNGFEKFSLGKTALTNSGLLQYKEGWRGKKRIVNYYRYDLLKNDFVRNNNNPHIITSLFRKLPLPLLNIVGFLFYRHMG
jgi:hypothetical protein